MDPYAQAHAAYQAQQYGQQQQQLQQHGQNGMHQSQQPYGQPPAKRAKTGGGMVITRYAPPPGYTGPAQQPAPQPPPGWSQPQYGAQPHPCGQQGYPGYPQQVYPPQQYAPPPYAQSQYSGYPHQYPQHGYHYPPSASQPAWNGAPQSYAGAQQPPAWQAPSPAPPTSTPVPSSGPPPTHQHQHSRHNSIQSQHRRESSVVSATVLDGNGDAMPPEEEDDENSDDFTGECYFSRYPDKIDGSLSIGMIEAQYALPVKRALPSTWKEAEVELVAPRVPHPPDDECVSDYFTKAKQGENLRNVWQTNRWHEVKDDLIFTTFHPTPTAIVGMPELLANYRKRYDPSWYSRAQSTTPSVSVASSRSGTPHETVAGAGRGVMDLDDDVTPRQPPRNNHYQNYAPVQSDMLSHLENSLHHSRRPSRTSTASHSRHHSRTSSQAPGSPSKYTRPQPLPALKARDNAQENVLAALGVTGSPKTIYPTPDPARPSRDNSAAPSDRSNSVHSTFDGYNARFPPPPPPPEQTNRSPSPFNPWRANGYAQPRPTSAQSQHTAAGSDFDPAPDTEATPRAKGWPHNDDRTESRKRGLEEIEEEPSSASKTHRHLSNGNDSVKRSVEGSTPPPPKMQYRRQPKIHAAYSRRW